MSQPVSPAIIRALLDKVDSGNGRGGVLGIRGRPVWDGPDIEHRGKPVQVAACESALAVRAALAGRNQDGWLVVLTDRDEDDLGLGITAHFSGRRLRQPDPWDAVCSGFEANRIDQRLASSEHRTELAAALLLARPASGWQPARGGMLTLDHALGSVAAARLGLGAPDADLDLSAVLEWSANAAPGQLDAARCAADLAALVGPLLASRVTDWIASRCGRLREPVAALLRAGRVSDLVPFGLIARAINATGHDSGPRALFRREVSVAVTDTVLAPWADAAEQVMRRILANGDTDAAAALLARSDVLLTNLEAADHADASPLLQRGLTARLATLGEALYRNVERAPSKAAAESVDARLTDPTVPTPSNRHGSRSSSMPSPLGRPNIVWVAAWPACDWCGG